MLSIVGRAQSWCFCPHLAGTPALLLGQECLGQARKERRPDKALSFRIQLKTPKQKQSVSAGTSFSARIPSLAGGLNAFKSWIMAGSTNEGCQRPIPDWLCRLP
jgi:hypothetical protein